MRIPIAPLIERMHARCWLLTASVLPTGPTFDFFQNLTLALALLPDAA